ncbi:MAG: hypothetical protein HYT96_03050 [Armatimonadetes bacterium]|nr:hypothetical protein [Armatimonadota bacterium]
MSGQLPANELTGRRLYEALDLCLECKGCKAECPANVDMAKLKYEFLAHYNEANGVPLRARLFGNFRVMARLGSATAPLSNWAAQAAPVRWTMDRFIGIDARRRLPPFARHTFLNWWKTRVSDNAVTRQRGNATRGTVALFPDTFMIYNYPEIGRAAVGLLEQLGFEVVLAPAGCCGRTMISKGLLNSAKAAARRNVAALLPLAERGISIVGCEPSCILAFRDEVPDLVPGEEAQAVARQTMLIDEFLAREHERTPLPLGRVSSGSRVLFHGHCHQKAIAGTAGARSVLTAAGFAVEEVDSGCCGMAGSFGFEKEHYDVSRAIGERRLLPAVRSQPPSVPIVAMGVSCRQQIVHGTGRRALHLVELLNQALRSGNVSSLP